MTFSWHCHIYPWQEHSRLSPRSRCYSSSLVYAYRHSIAHSKCLLFKSADVAVGLTEALQDRVMAPLYLIIALAVSTGSNREDAKDIGGRGKSRFEVKPNPSQKPPPSGSPRGEFTIKMCYTTGQLILIACIASPDSCSFLLPFGAYHINQKRDAENNDMIILRI
jgi:hypothetical protein